MKGVYCLCIENHLDQIIQIGALGKLEFKKGRYIYAGSALNSLIPRLKRHLKMSQGKHYIYHWHIDYFLRVPNVELKTIYIKETEEHFECILAEMIAEYGSPIPSFGCSDCNCSSHLYMVEDFEFIEKKGLKKWVRGSPRLLESAEWPTH